MDPRYLIINPGSASKKYALYAGEKKLCALYLEEEGGSFTALLKTTDAAAQKKIAISEKDYRAGLSYALARMKTAARGEGREAHIAGAGIRVVAPGAYFLSHAIIDDGYLAQLKKAREKAPLHTAAILAELSQLHAVMPAIPVAGISDSAFHAGMPAYARRYALPEETAEKYDLYRFGYHGISLQSALKRIEEITKTPPPPRIIACHLGSGASVTALRRGKSIDTSMGFTPLEGLVMGTRIGNIDAGAVLYLLEKSKTNPAKLLSFFNDRCGLLGLSGGAADMRELILGETRGEQKAEQALAHFAYHVKKYIGAYAAILGGIDLLVFTGAIGERSFIMRERICDGLAHLGIALDNKKNNSATGADAFIERNGATAKIAVIAADELRVIAHETAQLLHKIKHKIKD